MKIVTNNQHRPILFWWGLTIWIRLRRRSLLGTEANCMI